MIGIFDSGVGGLTVLRELGKAIPDEQLVYIGDTARVPWGNKSPKTVRSYAQEITEFLIKQGARRIVIACNTASALAASQLKKEYPKMTFYDVVGPCVDRTILEGKKNVLVIGTNATIQSGIYEKYLRRKGFPGKIYSQACPLFVPLIEEGLQNDPIMAALVDRYLKSYKNRNIEQVVLGCTHYPLMKRTLVNIFGKDVSLIDSAREVAKIVRKDLEGKKGKKKFTDKLFFSDWSKHNETFVKKMILGRYKIKIQQFSPR